MMLKYGWAAVGGLASACAASAQESTCRITEQPREISTDVRETSGVAVGRRYPNVLWTHNDSGNGPEHLASTPDGRVRARVAIQGAALTDSEDIGIGPCGAGSCL